eukprot:COSAG03_NODE_5764_length_1179_cov_3.876852_1_plen_129_part_10
MQNALEVSLFLSLSPPPPPPPPLSLILLPGCLPPFLFPLALQARRLAIVAALEQPEKMDDENMLEELKQITVCSYHARTAHKRAAGGAEGRGWGLTVLATCCAHTASLLTHPPPRPPPHPSPAVPPRSC